MKLVTNDQPVMRIGMGEEREFKIKATAKAFRILSSGLYKDKILAILREISANAYDAHKAAGIPDKPFAVHLPNAIEPFLSIRDFGKGLSQTDMEHIYTTYFESTKTETNDLIGGLGLGCKSPFSYVNSFSVISRHDGVKTTYDAFIDDTGMPAIAVRNQTSMEEGEETGLEVVVPVTKAQECQEFAHKARTVWTYYPVKPTVTGVADFKVETYASVVEGEGWRLTKRQRSYHDDYAALSKFRTGGFQLMNHIRSSSGWGHYGGSQARAIMGVVAYPIDMESLLSASTDPKDSEFWNDGMISNILSTPFEIDFDVGALDITAGREELSYEPLTIKNLRDRLQEVANDIQKKVNEQFASCTTVAEAKRLYLKLFNGQSPLAQALGHQNFKVEVNGVEVKDGYFNIELTKKPKHGKTCFPDLTVHHYSDGYSGNTKNHTTYVRDKRTDDYNSYYRNDPVITVSVEGSPALFYNDVGQAPHARLYEWRKDKANRDRVCYVFDTADEADLAAIRKHLDGLEILPVSSLPKPPPGKKKAKATVKVLDPKAIVGDAVLKTTHNTDKPGSHWKDEEIDLDQGGLYVLTKHNCFVFEDSAYYGSSDDFSKVFVHARKLGLIDPDKETLIAVPATEAKIIKKDKWKLVTDVIRDRLLEKLSKNSEIGIELEKARSRMAFRYRGEYSWTRVMNYLHENLKDSDHIVSKLVTELKDQSKLNSDLDIYQEIVQLMNVRVPVENPEQYSLSGMWQNFLRKYPMLVYAFRGNPDSDHVLTYVRLVDAAEKSATTAASSATSVDTSAA